MAKQSKQSESAELGTKRGAYPYYGFRKCLDTATAVRDLGGSRNDVQKSILAHHLEVDESSAAFKQLIGAVKCFGLIQGWGTYSLTDIGKEYFFPTDETQKRQAMLKALKMPIVFEQLIKRFDGGRVPSSNLLSNVLRREFNVSESWSPRVAGLFVSSLRDTAVIDAGGFLRYDAAMHSANGLAPQSEAAPSHEAGEAPNKPLASPERFAQGSVATSTAVRPIAEDSDLDVTVWQRSHRSGHVRLESRGELPLELWQRLHAFIQTLKPETEQPMRRNERATEATDSGSA